jgi:hypothetical protein
VPAAKKVATEKNIRLNGQSPGVASKAGGQQNPAKPLPPAADDCGTLVSFSSSQINRFSRSHIRKYVTKQSVVNVNRTLMICRSHFICSIRCHRTRPDHLRWLQESQAVTDGGSCSRRRGAEPGGRAQFGCPIRDDTRTSGRRRLRHIRPPLYSMRENAKRRAVRINLRHEP